MKYCIWFGFFSLIFSSIGCIPHKHVVFFQKPENAPADLTYQNEDYEFVIGSFDILALKIAGFTNEEGQNVVAPFNTPVTATGAGGLGAYASGIVVDKEGQIELLYVGKIKVAGLTLPQAGDTIRAALSQYIIDTGNNITVDLKILNYSITVLGEVGAQGIIKAENEYVTITEALAKSGGITPFGNMKTVRLIRTDRLTKKTTTYRLDLTTDIPVSPILSRLQPNDILVVDPLPRKQFSTAGQTIGLVSTFVSVPLLIVSIYNVIRGFGN